ncbi:hypothetical protein CALVIDRAFT_151378 [Calocera viscosa TUFC12733]|uniref:Sfi1 spindle body domain-containing protein n=1 Tax=Calocera viscosa (strain TUFC12733) TaxID=1330018 RepID=A0A167LK70_CALVF|nr:hypothetical protein CALVIDRAFT_151378 [Calocera viscosa TUFC12733]
MDDLSTSSSVSSVPLSSLSHADLQLVEEIISRAPISGSSIGALTDAYEKVLEAHGLEEDAVLYRVLLKLHAIRAPSWRERWEILKRVNGVVRGGRLEEDETEYSASEGASETESEGTAEPDRRRYSDSPIVKARSYRESTPSYVPPAIPKSAVRGALPTPAPSEASRAVHWKDNSVPPISDRALRQPPLPPMTVQSGISRSQTTPSMINASRRLFEKSASPPRLRASTGPQSTRTSATGRAFPDRMKALGNGTTRIAPPLPSQRGPEEPGGPDAWELMKMERDADDFRRNVTLNICFQRWRERAEVLVDNYGQVARASDEINLRECLDTWREVLVKHRNFVPRAANVDRIRRLMEFWRLWKDHKKEKDRKRMVQDLRQRMLAVRDMWESRLVRESWEKWLQAHRTRRAVLFHNATVLDRTVSIWFNKAKHLHALSAWADEIAAVKEERVFQHTWQTWRHVARLRVIEWAVVRRSNFHRTAEAFDLWRRNAQDSVLASSLYKRTALSHTLQTWKARFTAVKALSRRARMFADVRDKVLLFGALKTWVAEERCVLVVRIMEKRLATNSLYKWSNRAQVVLQMDDRALDFAYEVDCSCAINCYRLWTSRMEGHRNAERLANQYHTSQLSARSVSQWRAALNQLGVDRRRARMAHQALLLTSTWKAWQTALAHRRQEQWAAKLEHERLRTTFDHWVLVARRDRTHRLLVQAFQAHANSRVKGALLSKWVIRTADIKLQMMRAAEASDAKLLRDMVMNWIDRMQCHNENVSLMQSFRDVKQEDELRRTFHHWLRLGRRSRARRRRLQRREQESKLATMSVAWEAWRERFRERQLRDAEWAILIRNQQLALQFAFNHWKGRSQFLPAVHFATMQVRAHVWRVWRAALPNAHRARQAESFHKKHLLEDTFQGWKSAYKTSIARKAIARARAMRTGRTSLPAFPVAAISSIPGSSSLKRLPPTPSDSDTSPPSPTTDLPHAHTHNTADGTGHVAFKENHDPRRAQSVTPLTVRATKSTVGDVTPRDRLWKELLKARSESRKR